MSSSASYTFVLNGPRNLVANFVQVSYTIQVSADPVKGGTVTGAGTFPSGSTQTVTATAKKKYKFKKWLENGVTVSLSKSFTFVLNGNRNLVAKFKKK